MDAQKNNILSDFTDIESLSLDYDFNNDGKVDLEDYKTALRQMQISGTKNAFGYNKEQIEDVFAQFVSTFSEDSNTPISFSDGTNTFHFFEDRDENGIFDDSSELLGSQDGMMELQSYDLDGNGKIDGDELKHLKLIKVNQETGEFQYMTALDAGINEIDLSSLVDMNIKQMSDTISNMSLDIKMLNGETLSTMQNEELLKPIEEEFANIFGSKITDYSDKIDDTSYMEDFVKEMDIQSPIEGV